MKFTVSETVRREATRCSHDYSCLTDGLCKDSPLCQAESTSGKNVIFLKPVDKDKVAPGCPYLLSYAGERVCICPVHYDIYQQKKRQMP